MKKSVPIVLALLFALSLDVHAQWSNNPAVNTPLAVGKSGRYDLYVISDGSGNTYLTWYDGSSNSKGGVYVQKITASGTLPWGLGGICVDSIQQTFEKPSIALDGNGGVFVTWGDSRPDNTLPNIYGQHVSSAGAVLWISNGINITASFTVGLSFRQPDNPQMLSDGHNGSHVSWDDAFGLVLMRIDSTGALAWSTIVDGVYGATDTRICSDDSGGVILTWTDDRNAATGDLADIYAQRVDPSGSAKWAANGVVISSAAKLQNYPQIAKDGLGGAVIAWEDFRDSAQYLGYAQRVNANGAVQWMANGLALTANKNAVNSLTMAADGSGGGIFTWEESRGGGIGGSDNIFAQRVNGTGQRQWTDTGANVCTNTAPQENPRIVSDGNGGAIITWEDNRNNGANQDIYAQRMNASGAPQWTTDGIAVSSAANNQNSPSIVAYPGNGAVIIWDDYRTNGNGNVYPDLYAQNISGGGTLSDVRPGGGSLPESFQLQQNYPNPFNPTTIIQFTVPSNGRALLKVFNILGQEVATLFNSETSAGISHQVEFNASNFASGIYFSRLEFGGKMQMKKMLLLK